MINRTREGERVTEINIFSDTHTARENERARVSTSGVGSIGEDIGTVKSGRNCESHL